MEETHFLAPYNDKFDDKIELPSFAEYFSAESQVFVAAEPEPELELVEEELVSERISRNEEAKKKQKQSEDSFTRHSTSIYQMLERVENKIKAEEHQKKFGFDSEAIKPSVTEKHQKNDLWVDKYRPQKFTQLITMDSCNLEVLRWINQWDFAKDIVMGKPRGEVLQRMDEHRKKTVTAVKSYHNPRYNNRGPNSSTNQDHLDRPERKILLVHGQPGLGKTTLAHVVAKTAGYSVIEINASDERMGNSVITKISSALAVKASFTSERKPTMIVIDEIDGAAAAGNENNLIKYLVKLATTKSTGNKRNFNNNKHTILRVDGSESDNEELANSKEAVSSKPKKMISDDLGLLHPIICICNDLYVPALRPLRQVAHILQVKPIGPVQLSLRLKTICDREGLKINTRTLVDLSELMDSDVRSTLNALQFLHKKTVSGNASSFTKELTFGAFKDTVKPPMKIYDAIFHNNPSNNSIKRASPHNPNLSTTISTERKYSELLEMIWGSGVESDKLMNGSFEIYPTTKYFDNTTMDRVNSALELFSTFDLMSNPRNSSIVSNGRFEGYLACKLCGLKELFSSPVYTVIKYPKEDFENFQINSEFKAIFKDYLSTLSPKIKTESGSREHLLLERIPAVLNSSLSRFSTIKSSNPQLMRPDDKKKLARSVEILSSEGMLLRQIKIIDSASYKFVLDPPIDRLTLDHLTCPNELTFSAIYGTETVQDSHTYSICRLTAAEIEALRIRKLKSKHETSPSTSTAETVQNIPESPSPSVPAQKRKSIGISQVALPKDFKKRVARDFFGRPIVIPDGKDDALASTLKKTESVEPKMTLWYVQNDGVSNAVRRNVKISSFFNS